MKKEISKREQRKQEKIMQENIQKFHEEYEKSRKMPEEYEKKIKSRMMKNTIIAFMIITYLWGINILSSYVETSMYIGGNKILCIILSLISIIYFEFSYRKDNGYLFLYGAEFLVLATITLFSVYAYSIFYISYQSILLYILIGVAIYYILKTFITLRCMKKQYYDSQNDIKEIVKKEKNKND